MELHGKGPEVLGEIARRFARGEVGVVPTDTLYGLSGDARDLEIVSRINALKGRAQPVTVIPHALDWARAQVADPALFDAQFSSNRGDTHLFPVGDSDLPAAVVSTGLVSFRWPDHVISAVSARAEVPLITTSVNRTGSPPMRSRADLDAVISAGVDFIWLDGELTGAPSTLRFFDVDPPRVVQRD